MFLLTQTELEFDDYKHGFENAILEVHRQYNLKRKKNNDSSNIKDLNNSARKTLEYDLKKIAESSKRNDNNSEKRNKENIIKKKIDVSTKIVQTEIPTTSKQAELVTKTKAHKIDFPNLLKSQTPFNIEN